MSELVRLEREREIGVIVIDHAPVNTLTAAVRAALIRAIETLNTDPSLKSGVLTCAGRSFITGSDLREYDAATPGAMLTDDVCRALDHCGKPVVAAMFGNALGGGLEVALACHARVIAPDGLVGLPEIKIGLTPGGGGSQRLPRLIGALPALDIIASGRQVTAVEALQLGLVDEIGTDVRRLAVSRARTMAQTCECPRVRDRAVPPLDRTVFDKAAEALSTRARGAAAPAAAAEAVANALDRSFDDGIAAEAALFQRLLAGPQSKALRHIHMAERAASRLPKGIPPDTQVWPVRETGVIGGGTMGAGIAIALANAGLNVTLVESSLSTLERAQSRIAAIYDRLLQQGRLSATDHAERLARIGYAADVDALADCDLVIEATDEDIAANQRLFRQLSAVTRRHTLLASNTSRLDIELLADMVDNPERVIGLHFFQPAYATRLLEIGRPSRLARSGLATALAVANRLGKQPVISGICDGLICNRIVSRSRQQMELMLSEGVSPHEIDAAFEAWGMASGPNGKRENGHAAIAPTNQAAAERIQTRTLAAMVNEGAKIVGEGIAARPSDVDVALVHGFGFPAWRGGPMHAADAMGLGEVLKTVREMHAQSGPGMEPAPLLEQLVAAKQNFASLNR